MTTVTETAVEALLTDTTTTRVRPRYEGSNISTWIGFKHINYMVEEVVLEHFRQAGLSARGLYEEHGLGLDIVGLDTRILQSFHMDDLVDAEVVPNTKEGDHTFGFKVTLSVERDGEVQKASTSKVRVSLRVDTYLEEAGEIPAALSRFAVDRLGTDSEREPAADAGPRDEVLERLLEGKNAYGWKWTIPYPYCHFTERLQMSGYLRLMEEAKDRFVADRGISIKTLLDERRWIPAVPRSDIRILDEALMEEDLYTVYEVEEIFKDFTYTSRVDWYVVRDGRLLKTATGRIVHGYAVIANRRDWSLEHFDQRVMDALNNKAQQG
ncbi:hypothetical protein JL475_26530 [Streptomyces sp. M2CJ-2]|uniref:hypothetical protein n=1 Tax=Streptomyces sp. M2CJ-2 TaxID=2803948 RepID=UPI00192974A2|nr:hypothetical protein [Streptomyces sp. M2CJ-2]MBL3669477.1 hypothetical protein [Streptomyces sp. M2CJ-2]